MADNINPDHYKRLPSEAIEIIEAAIEGAPTSQEAYLQGQALKYLLRANHKNGREDIHKAKWYLDRMVASFTVPSDLLDGLVKTWKPEGGKCKQVYPEQSQPPDGWRWLERGELIRNGDRYFDGDKWKDRDWAIKETYSLMHQKTIRRNRFEVGEKVVRVVNGVVYKVIRILSMGYQLESEFCAEVILHGKDLAPYIEDVT